MIYYVLSKFWKDLVNFEKTERSGRNTPLVPKNEILESETKLFLAQSIYAAVFWEKKTPFLVNYILHSPFYDLQTYMGGRHPVQ